MKKKIAVAMLVVTAMALGAAASDRRGADLDRVQTSSTILNQIMSAPDKGIPDSIMNGAKCIAIVPSNLKASFIFGANYGKGVATCRTDHGLERARVLQDDRRQLWLPGGRPSL